MSSLKSSLVTVRLIWQQVCPTHYLLWQANLYGFKLEGKDRGIESWSHLHSSKFASAARIFLSSSVAGA